MNKNKKRSNKFATTLRRYNTDSIDKGGLYYLNKKGGFSTRKPLDVKIDGIKVSMYLELYKELQDTHKDLKHYVGTQIGVLTAFLTKKGYNTSNIELDAVIKDLEHLLIIQDTKEYEVLSVDENGYLNGIGTIKPTSIIIDKQPRPNDFDLGYYNYIDGEYVVDEDRKALLSGGVF